MNKGLYKCGDGKYIYWYKTWKNSEENSGTTIAMLGHDDLGKTWDWDNYDTDYHDQLVGAACLAQW